MGAMNQEDEQQYSKLRDKYAGMASNATVDPASYDDSKYQQLAVHQPPGGAVGSGSKPGDNVDVKLCAMCQGTGKQLEDYNNRRLERFCTPCNGKGVNIWKDGKEVSDPEPASTSARAPKAAHSPGSVCARLEADLASIDAKLKVYAEERAGVLVGAEERAAVLAGADG
ncbi:hypothetical protein FOA52_015838 [Chlamydomonas sp. UWO 241]|nr:hypothetical protein FOA52_015838 [Chlamydomonas sp. UWO 241]